MGGLPTKQAVAAFAADSTKSPVMIAALKNGLWKSRDEGKTWQRVATAPSGVTALAVHPIDQDRLFAGTSQGTLFRSADGGVSWQATP